MTVVECEDCGAWVNVKDDFKDGAPDCPNCGYGLDKAFEVDAKLLANPKNKVGFTI